MAAPQLASLSNRPAKTNREGTRAIRAELLCLSVALLLLNLPLLNGGCDPRLVFLPERVLAGEWWRIVTHPFIHVSPYHLILDGSAFLLLYAEFPGWSTSRRLSVVAICAIGSLLGGLTSPFIASRGLCGLSGAAHGLMALSAFQMIRRQDRVNRILGGGMLAGLLLKCAYELATGQTPFASLHLGSVGFPIVACHAGGVVAGLVFAVLAGSGFGHVANRVGAGSAARSSSGKRM
jgi:rhomboid family GlyGly-CTERM serine protease